MNSQEYYSYQEVLFEIVKLAKGRELSFIGRRYKQVTRTKEEEKKAYFAVRCIKAHAISYLLSNFDAFSFHQKSLNIYYSLASLSGMPMFTFDMEKRSIQQKDFVEKFEHFVVDYDFGLDFDAKPDFKQCYADTKKVKELFDEYKVPYYLVFSGSGFHINVSGAYYLSNGLGKTLDRLNVFKSLAFELFELLNLPSLDKTVYDARRIWKMPYSFDYKTGNICLPLSDVQFQIFDEEIVKPEIVIEHGVKNRGLLERNIGSKGFTNLILDLLGGKV